MSKGPMEYPEGHLMAEAQELARNLGGRLAGLEAELAELDKRRAEIARQVEAAKAADARYDDFEPKVIGNLQCPRCWIYEAEHASIRPIRGTADEDFFRCNGCNLEYRFRFR